MTQDLSHRVALVTGASRGLGAAIARALAGCGAAVAVNYHASADNAEALVAGIRAAGGRAMAIRADVRDEEQVRRMVDEVARQFGPIDVLVVNATGPQPMLKIEQLTWQACLDQLEFFVKSPMLLLQALLPSMKARRFGRIIQIGSEVFENGVPKFSNYVSAKGAQLGLTRSWAMELAGSPPNGTRPIPRKPGTPTRPKCRWGGWACRPTSRRPSPSSPPMPPTSSPAKNSPSTAGTRWCDTFLRDEGKRIGPRMDANGHE